MLQHESNSDLIADAARAAAEAISRRPIVIHKPQSAGKTEGSMNAIAAFKFLCEKYGRSIRHIEIPKYPRFPEPMIRESFAAMPGERKIIGTLTCGDVTHDILEELVRDNNILGIGIR